MMSSKNVISSNVKATTRTKQLNSSSKTISWDELPEWQQDNHYIRNGYRPASGSLIKSFTSLGYLHNESVNIYSHLLGAIFFTFLGSILYYMDRLQSNHSHSYHHSQNLFHDINFMHQTKESSSIGADDNPTLPAVSPSVENMVFSCFFAGAILCLAMSGTYHTISNHSSHICRFGNKLDYIGIICLVIGSFIPSIFYGFYCYPAFQKFYWNMICTFGLACAVITIFDRFRTPAWRPYRAIMFVALGCSSIFPVIHGLSIFGFHTMRNRMGLVGLVLEGFFYILGAIIYVARWPERLKPGAFDIWGGSHQIFHILVLVAACFHCYSLRTAFNFHHQVMGAKCTS